jgi:hypothetical protein
MFRLSVPCHTGRAARCSRLSCLCRRAGLSQGRRSQFANLVHEFGNHLCKAGPLRGRYPFEVQPRGIDTGEFQDLPEKRNPFYRHVITIQVMAVSDVSPAHKDAVRSFLKGLQNLVRTDGCGTQGSNGTEVRRILQTADAGKVSAGVRAPVAEKADYSRFKLFCGHYHSPSHRKMFVYLYPDRQIALRHPASARSIWA